MNKNISNSKIISILFSGSKNKNFRRIIQRAIRKSNLQHKLNRHKCRVKSMIYLLVYLNQKKLIEEAMKKQPNLKFWKAKQLRKMIKLYMKTKRLLLNQNNPNLYAVSNEFNNFIRAIIKTEKGKKLKKVKNKVALFDKLGPAYKEFSIVYIQPMKKSMNRIKAVVYQRTGSAIISDKTGTYEFKSADTILKPLAGDDPVGVIIPRNINQQVIRTAGDPYSTGLRDITGYKYGGKRMKTEFGKSRKAFEKYNKKRKIIIMPIELFIKTKELRNLKILHQEQRDRETVRDIMVKNRLIKEKNKTKRLANAKYYLKTGKNPYSTTLNKLHKEFLHEHLLLGSAKPKEQIQSEMKKKKRIISQIYRNITLTNKILSKRKLNLKLKPNRKDLLNKDNKTLIQMKDKLLNEKRLLQNKPKIEKGEILWRNCERIFIPEEKQEIKSLEKQKLELEKDMKDKFSRLDKLFDKLEEKSEFMGGKKKNKKLYGISKSKWRI